MWFSLLCCTLLLLCSVGCEFGCIIFLYPMVEKVSFRCLIRMTYLLCRIFLYITILLDFLFWFLWEDFQLDIGQPQHFGHVAWLDSLPLLDIIFSFVYTLCNRILYLHLPNGSIFEYCISGLKSSSPIELTKRDEKEFWECEGRKLILRQFLRFHRR